MQAASPGEIETERKITVACEAEFYDAVKKKTLWKRSFSDFETYGLANAQEERNEAVFRALERVGEDILLAVVSAW